MKKVWKKNKNAMCNEQNISEKLAKYTVLLPPLIILLITSGIYIAVLYQSLDGEKLSTIELIKYWAVNLCPVAISISVGTLLYEFFGNVKYVEKRLKNIVIESDYIDTLSYDKKKELRKNVIESIYSKNSPEILNEANNITTILNEDVAAILEDYYYEIKDYYIDVYKKENYIEKEIRFAYEAKAINGQKHCLVSHLKVILTQVEQQAGEEDISASSDENRVCAESKFDSEKKHYNGLEVKEASINGKVFTDSELKELVKAGEKCDESLHEYTYSSEAYIKQHTEMFTFKDKISGSITYTTRVPLDDLSITIRTPKACKKCCIHIKSDAYRFEPLSFVFGSIPNRKKVKIYNSKYGVDVDINDWMLPGEGVTFILQEERD